MFQMMSAVLKHLGGGRGKAATSCLDPPLSGFGAIMFERTEIFLCGFFIAFCNE